MGIPVRVGVGVDVPVCVYVCVCLPVYLTVSLCVCVCVGVAVFLARFDFPNHTLGHSQFPSPIPVDSFCPLPGLPGYPYTVYKVLLLGG